MLSFLKNNCETNKKLLKDEKKKLVTVDNKNGLEAITKYKKIISNDKYSLLKVQLLTGRTHQIRVHMSSIKHPIINDEKYGDYKENKEFKSNSKSFKSIFDGVQHFQQQIQFFCVFLKHKTNPFPIYLNNK